MQSLKNKEKKNSFEQREQFKLTKNCKLYFYRTLNVVQKNCRGDCVSMCVSVLLSCPHIM